MESLMQRLDLDSGTTTPVLTPPESVGDWDTADEAIDVCPDCAVAHIPRRIVCCVDGTWMEPDGMAGFLADSFRGNASNVFRIWCSVKEGVVKDAHGKSWQQIRKYWKGLGAELESVPRLIAGVLGNGFERLIYKVYKFCATSCCPSRDEIFLFGFSRGAFVVRAVAGLFQHLRTLNPRDHDFEDLYAQALKVYRHIRSKNEFRQHEIYHHIVAHTLKSPKIRFLGAIDTVKGVINENLYDISHTANTDHVRHALALLEQRFFFKSSTYNPSLMSLGGGRTCMEAWFLGGHGNLGGSREADGLSLWPLQWLLSDAQSHAGLVLGFQALDGVNVQDPLIYTMPRGTQEEHIPLRDGMIIRMWDLTEQFSESKFLPVVSVERSKLGELAEAEREILSRDSGSGFVHPSVFYHDDMTPLGLIWLNSLKSRHAIRGNRKRLALQWHELFWNREFKQRVDLTLRHPRVLVCGAFGAGKSALINLALGENVAVENEEYTPTDHNTERELASSCSHFNFHDSCGFEPGQQDHFAKVQEFLDSRRRQTTFTSQLHCVWYCIGARQRRISTCDQEFFSRVDFNRVTVILVFTQSDDLRNSCPQKARDWYQARHGVRLPARASQIPPDVQQALERLEDDIFEEEKAMKVEKVKALLGDKARDLMSVFVSKYDEDTTPLTTLLTTTESLLRSPVMLSIHNAAVANGLASLRPAAVQAVRAIGLKARSKLLDPFDSDAAAVVFRSFLAQAQGALREVHKPLKLRSDVQFTDFDVLFAGLYVERSRGSALAEVLGTTLGTVGGLTMNGLFAAASVPILGPLVLVGGGLAVAATVTLFTRTKEILVQCALLLLAYERLVWFGVVDVSEEMVSRAVIEVLKISPDVETRVHAEVKLIGSVDWRKILTETVEEFRYRGA